MVRGEVGQGIPGRLPPIPLFENYPMIVTGTRSSEILSMILDSGVASDLVHALYEDDPLDAIATALDLDTVRVEDVQAVRQEVARRSQELLRRVYGEEVTAYRGLTGSEGFTNTVSLTLDRGVARRASRGGLWQLRIPVSEILSYSEALGKGTFAEEEIIVPWPVAQETSVSVEESASMKVKCQECGKVFKSGSMSPKCPKCGSYDVDLAESKRVSESLASNSGWSELGGSTLEAREYSGFTPVDPDVACISCGTPWEAAGQKFYVLTGEIPNTYEYGPVCFSCKEDTPPPYERGEEYDPDTNLDRDFENRSAWMGYESVTEGNHRRCEGCNRFMQVTEYADGITNRCSRCQEKALSKMESTRVYREESSDSFLDSIAAEVRHTLASIDPNIEVKIRMWDGDLVLSVLPPEGSYTDNASRMRIADVVIGEIKRLGLILFGSDRESLNFCTSGYVRESTNSGKSFSTKRGATAMKLTVRDLIEQVARGKNAQAAVAAYLNSLREEEVIPASADASFPTTGTKSKGEEGEAEDTAFTTPDPTVAGDEPGDAEKKAKSAPTDGGNLSFAEKYRKQAKSVLDKFLKEEDEEDDDLEEEDEDGKDDDKPDFLKKKDKEESRRRRLARKIREQDDEDEDELEEEDDEEDDKKEESRLRAKARKLREKDDEDDEELEEEDDEEIEEEDDDEEDKDKKEESRRRLRRRMEALRRKSRKIREQDDEEDELEEEDDEEIEEEEDEKKDLRDKSGEAKEARRRRPFAVKEKVDAKDTADPQYQIGEDVIYSGSEGAYGDGKIVQQFPHGDGYLYAVAFGNGQSLVVPHEDLKRKGGLFGESKKVREGEKRQPFRRAKLREWDSEDGLYKATLPSGSEVALGDTITISHPDTGEVFIGTLFYINDSGTRVSVETNIGRVIGGVPVENVIEESKRSRKRVVKEGFMEPEIYYGTAYEVDTTHGTEIIPVDVVGAVTDIQQLRDYCEGDPLSFREVTGWIGRYQAPGYLDSTPWAIYDSAEEAQADLADMYGDEEDFDESRKRK